VHTPYGWHLVEALERDTVKTVRREGIRIDNRRQAAHRGARPATHPHPRHAEPGRQSTRAPRRLAERVARTSARQGHQLRRPSVHPLQQCTMALRHRYPRADVGVRLRSAGPASRRFRRRARFASRSARWSEVLTQPERLQPVQGQLDRHPEREYTIEEIRNDLPDAVQQVPVSRETYEAWLKTLRSQGADRITAAL